MLNFKMGVELLLACLLYASRLWVDSSLVLTCLEPKHIEFLILSKHCVFSA